MPQDAKLWDVSAAPTIVMTQRRVRSTFQARLRDRGVEVIEFDFLTPDAVAEYCYARGFMQLLWECGGMLAAPAIAGNAIHKVMAFVAPKLVRWWSMTLVNDVSVSMTLVNGGWLVNGGNACTSLCVQMLPCMCPVICHSRY